MKIYYSCEHCGQEIDMIEVEQVDETKFGFDCLTAEERQDIIKFDAVTNTMYVHSLCDQCIELLGLGNEEDTFPKISLLH